MTDPNQTTADRASFFIGHDTDLRTMCLKLGININFLAEKMTDFADAESKAAVERFVREVEAIAIEPAGDDLFDGNQLLSSAALQRVMKSVFREMFGEELKDEN